MVCVVPGCGTHWVRCNERIKRVGQQGGHQERKPCDDRFICPDAETGLDDLFAFCQGLSSTNNIALTTIEIQDQHEDDANYNDAI
eukprot:10273308-Ditylum_brightwellii.AAC.2